MEYQRDEHRVHLIVYHLVGTPKRRKPVLIGAIAQDCRGLIEGKCAEQGWHILELAINPDHVHLFVRVGPSTAAVEVVRQCKGGHPTAALALDALVLCGHGGERSERGDPTIPCRPEGSVMGTAHATRTVRQQIEYRPGISEWFGTTQELFNRVAAFYFNVLRDRPGILELSSKDMAHRVSRRIVEFAQAHGATVIVFEHLGSFRPEKGRYSRRANSRRAYWLRGRTFHYTRYKAWAEGMLTSRVSPRDTSRRCAACGAEVARYGEGERPISYRPGAPLVFCPTCRVRGSADRNAALNIGRRLLARYGSVEQEKPHPRPVWRGSPQGEGVLVPQKAPNGCRPHAEPARHGEQDGHGTAREEPHGAACVLDGIPRFLRVGGGGYAASTPETAHAGVPEEAAGL